MMIARTKLVFIHNFNEKLCATIQLNGQKHAK